MLTRHLLISRSMLIAIIFCFFLPFITVSCASVPVKATASGMNFITGADVRVDTPDGPRLSGDKIHPDSKLIVALIASIISLVVTFVKLPAKIQSIAIAIGTGIGSLFFFMFKSALDNESRAQSSQLILTYESGFWIAWLLLILTVAMNIWIIYQMSTTKIMLPQAGAAYTMPSSTTTGVLVKGGASSDEVQYCPHCGKSIEVRSNFCMYCGKDLPPKI